MAEDAAPEPAAASGPASGPVPAPVPAPASGPVPDVAWSRSVPARYTRDALLNGVLRPMVWAYTRPRTVGVEHLRALGTGPAVLAASHASHLDTPVLLLSLPGPLRRHTVVVAAADYFFARWWVSAPVSLAFGTVPVQRRAAPGSGDTARLDALIDNGWSVAMYPEGTRSRDGRVGRLRLGAAFLAARHGVPLVPIRLAGTQQAMPVGARWARRHDVVVHVGPPLLPGTDEGFRALHRRLTAAMTSLAAVADAPPGAPPDAPPDAPPHAPRLA